MNSIARRLLGTAAAAVARKLLPDVIDNPGSALALRPPIGELLPPVDRRRSEENFLPTVRSSQTLYAPPPSPPQIYYAPSPAPQPQRRRNRRYRRNHLEVVT